MAILGRSRHGLRVIALHIYFVRCLQWQSMSRLAYGCLLLHQTLCSLDSATKDQCQQWKRGSCSHLRRGPHYTHNRKSRKTLDFVGPKDALLVTVTHLLQKISHSNSIWKSLSCVDMRIRSILLVDNERPCQKAMWYSGKAFEVLRRHRYQATPRWLVLVLTCTMSILNMRSDSPKAEAGPQNIIAQRNLCNAAAIHGNTRHECSTDRSGYSKSEALTATRMLVVRMSFKLICTTIFEPSCSLESWQQTQFRVSTGQYLAFDDD